jgi:hypothetical protein
MQSAGDFVWPSDFLTGGEMNRKRILPLGFLTAVLLLAGCQSYDYRTLRGPVGYGEAATVPFSQEYYYYNVASPYDYYPGYPYYYPYPYYPYYYPYYPYPYYPYYYPYPFYFGGSLIFHSPGGHAHPPPGRHFRPSSGGGGSPPPSGGSSTGGRQFKR